MLNPQRNAASSKRKFEIAITTLALFLCVVGLLGMSIISFFQTQSAFIPLNDPTMNFQGIEFGSWIALLAALIFQYGQNAALYVKNTYATGKVFIRILGIDIKDTTICWITFWICAGIDAGTNCLWLYNQPDIRKQHPIFQTIEYSAMICIVFVEEVLGIVLQALAHSFTLWRQVAIATKTSQRNEIPDKPKYQAQNKPNNNNQHNQQKPQNQQPNNQNQRVNPARPDPSYNNTQQSHRQPEKPSQSRMGNILKAPQNEPDWMREARLAQDSQKGRGLYPKMDDVEDLPNNLFS